MPKPTVIRFTTAPAPDPGIGHTLHVPAGEYVAMADYQAVRDELERYRKQGDPGRIAACLDACDGIPTKALEEEAIRKLKDACDSFLYQLDYIRQLNGDEAIMKTVADRARSALAALKGDAHV